MDLEATHKIYEEYAEILATKIFKHLDASSTITLDELREKISIKHKKKIDVNNWYEATCMAELLEFKNRELKQILSENSKRKTGNKKVLAMRVWNITHPETSVYKSKELQNTHENNEEIYHIDDSSDSDSSEDDNMDNIEAIIRHSAKIHINQEELIYLSKKRWVFKEFGHYYKFMGLLKDDIIHSCAIPEELKRYYL